MDKLYITGDALLLDSFRLAERVFCSGYRPDLIVGIWRGGSPVAIAIQEYFEYQGVGSDHIPIRAASYHGIGQREPEVRIDGLDYVIDHHRQGQDLLIVDDVFDTGLSVEAVLNQIVTGNGLSPKVSIKTAMPWYKPTNNRTGRVPDYYLHETDRWLVFPHEICGLSGEEIRQHKGPLAAILAPE